MTRFVFGCLFSAGLFISETVGAIPIHVQWPDGAGSYSIDAGAKQTSHASGTYEVGDDHRVSITTAGTGISFTVHHGKVVLPPDFATAFAGIQFDAASNTFTFTARDVHVEAKSFAEAITIDSQPGLSPNTFRLIPGRHGLVLGKKRLDFDLDGDGVVTLLGTREGLTSRGATITLAGMPGGVPIVAEPTPTDVDLRNRTLAMSEKAAWKSDFDLVEKMKIWNFSEQQVSYHLTVPAGLKAESLKLLAFTESTVRVIPFQLSHGEAGDTISFRTDLSKGAQRKFRLVSDFDAKDIPSVTSKPIALEPSSNAQEAVLGNDFLQVKVPAGHRDFVGGLPLEKAPPPILGLGRTARSKTWLASESFSGPDALKVTAMDAALIESGPVFARYSVTYQLEGGKTYATTIELRAGESHVLIAESVRGFTPEDQAVLRLEYGKGMLDPDRRMVASLGGVDRGYQRYSGAYDRNLSTDDRFRPWPLSASWLEYDPKLDDSKVPRLDFRLGLYMPNTLGVVHAATFYRENGDDALLISIDRPEEWKTAVRALWTDYRSVDNFRFYHDGDRKYMAAGLAGEKRFWAVGLIPRDDVAMRAADKVPAGPEVWLSTELGMWNLQAQKDRTIDWDEKLDSPVTPDVAETNKQLPVAVVPMSFEDYSKRYLEKSAIRDLVNFGPFFGYLNGRSFPGYYSAYLRSRSAWTPEQRERVRQILVFLTDYNDGDDYQPSHGMLSGHPNFLMDAKQNIALGLTAFPNHPKARAWRDSFLSFFDELLDKYERHDVPELNTRGGRWTENIACYWGQSMTGILNAELALKSYDGTTLAKNPRIFDLLRWMRDAMMSPQDGQRLVPPQGAHASAFMPGEPFRKSLFQLSAELAPGNPQLAQDMRWIETNGREGTRPDVRSVLYTDYGPIFHHDFGGPNESYAHLQNINGMSYRWGYAGIIYYGAKNKIWSYNGPEANGDDFDWEKLTALTVDGRGLTVSPTDQVLYDFDFAQFYREPGQADDAYRARALMLLRDDYLVVSDELKSPDVTATFRWVNAYEMPQIYQLKPGTKVEASTFDGAPHHRNDVPAEGFKRQTYSGKGDFLTIVAPTPVTAKAKPFGATVNGEFVFASQKPEEISKGSIVFSGNYGYARANQLALFQGTSIGLDGFLLSRSGGDFGASAAADKGKITGRMAGRSGGTISIVPPSGYNAAKAVVTMDGKTVPHTLDKGAISFVVEIAQRDGLKSYEITF